MVTLRGQVVDEHGVGVPRCFVAASHISGELHAIDEVTTTFDSFWSNAAAFPVLHTTTDHAGRFELKVFCRRKLLFGVRVSGFVDYDDQLLFPQPEDILDMGIIRLAMAARLRGAVIGDDGVGISGVEIYMRGSGAVSDGYRTAPNKTLVGSTDSNGRFLLSRLPLGTCVLEFYAKGHVPEVEEVPIDRIDNQITVDLRRATSIVGHVNGYAEGPLSVYVESDASHNMIERDFVVHCQADRSFVVPGLPDSDVPFKLRAYGSSTLTFPHPFLSPVCFALPGDASVIVDIPSPIALTATICDAGDATPLEGVTVSFWHQNGEILPRPRVDQLGGDYTVRLRPVGNLSRPHFIEFAKGTYEPVRKSVEPSLLRNGGHLGTVGLIARETCAVHVSGPSGTGVAGAAVRASPVRGELPYRIVSAGIPPRSLAFEGLSTYAGRVMLPLSSDVPYRVVVTHDDYAPLEMRLDPPVPEELSIELQHGATAHVSVLGSDGSASVRSLLVKAVWMGLTLYEEEYTRSFITDSLGRVDIERLGVGWYKFAAEGCEPVLEQLLPGTDVLELAFEVDAGVELCGHISVRGAPLAGAQVIARRGRAAVTDIEGNFVLRGLDGEIAGILLRHPAWGIVGRYTVDLTTVRPRLDVDLDPLVISGHVRDIYGSPLEQAEISLALSDAQGVRSLRFGWEASIRQTASDRNGYFELAPVQSEDHYGLIVKKQGYVDALVKEVGDGPVAIELSRSSLLRVRLQHFDPKNRLWLRATSEVYPEFVTELVALETAHELGPGDWNLEVRSDIYASPLDTASVTLFPGETADVLFSTH